MDTQRSGSASVRFHTFPRVLSVNFLKVSLHDGNNGEYEPKPPRQHANTDDQQVDDVTPRCDVIQVKDDIKEAREHQSEAHSRDTANQSHEQRELGQQYSNRYCEHNEERAQSINEHALPNGQRALLGRKAWG